MKIAAIYCELFLLLLTIAHCRNSPLNSHNNKIYWYDKNKNLLQNRMRTMQINSLPKVKNVIIFIGDGMGLTTITASRTHKRQVTKDPNARMTFDDFPATAFMQTDIMNCQIPESAASATALFCGVKTNFESVGIDTTAIGRDACKNIKSHTPSIIAWAQKKNLKTGFVTTTRVTHATPAALYAHSYRHAEHDSRTDSGDCGDIARQLIENDTGRNINVIMGGGMRNFIPESAGGRRKDEKNLTDEWINLHPKGNFVTTRDELMSIENHSDHLLGIFASSHMSFNSDRDVEIEPSLAEMTQSAIDVLKRNNSGGFLLIVESGKIDLAHHYNNAFRALDETLQLDIAIEVALRNIDLSSSLVIVTTDHASAMTYSGFATPKNLPILGMDKYLSNVDTKPYQILTYSSGRGHMFYNETEALTDFKNTYHKATIPTTWSNHAADDVPIYAIGSMANLLFSGTFDQTYIAHAVAYAMCLFEYESRCNNFGHVRHAKEKKGELKGIDALKQALNKEVLQSKATTEKNYFETEPTTDPVASIERFNAKILNTETYPEPFFESSDLVSNYEVNESNAVSPIYSNFFVYHILIVLLINVVC